MLHLFFISQLVHSLPVVSLAVVGFVGYARKIVKAVLDFAIYVLQEVARLVKAYHKVADEVRSEREHRAPRVRGRSPRAHARRVTPTIGEGSSKQTRTAGGNH